MVERTQVVHEGDEVPYLVTLCDVLRLGRDVTLDLGLQLARHGGLDWSLAGEAFVGKLARDENFLEPPLPAGARSRLSSFLLEKGHDTSEVGWVLESSRFGAEMTPVGGDIVSRLSSSTSPSETIKELGYGCTASVDYFKRIIGLMPAFGARELARVVAMLASTRDVLDPTATAATLAGVAAAVGLEPPRLETTWNYENAADALREARPDADWVEAMMHLDKAGAAWFLDTGSAEAPGVDARAPEAVLKMFARATDGERAFPVEAVCAGAAWESAPEAQAAFLAHAASCSAEAFDWRACRRVMPPVEGGILSAGASPVGTPNHAWLSLDLYLTLAAVARAGGAAPARARRAFDAGLGVCPDVVALGAAAAMAEEAAARGGVLAEVVATAIAAYLSSSGLGQGNSAAVLHRVWASGPGGQDGVAMAMAMAHEREGGPAVPRILDVCQDLKALSAALDRAPHALAVELAALAARREYLNLEKWLQERAAASGAPFAAACLRFLRARATGDDAGTLTPGAPKLAVETMAIFFKTLQAGAGGLPPDLRQELQGVAAAAARAHPALASAVASAGGAPGAATPGGGAIGGSAPGQAAGGSFPADVEAEANANFQLLYSGTRSAFETADMLARFRASRDARERDVFGCMVHNLFDEYRFFPKYPEKELRVTAVLFGRLIDLRLVASITLGVALRCVLDALRKPFGTKMFAFGSEALEQFKQRLAEWPQYCQHLAAVPHIVQAHPDLAALLGAAAERRGAARLGRDEPSVANGPESVLAAGVAGMNLAGDGAGIGANAAPPPPAPRPPAPPGAPPGGADGAALHHAQSMPAMKPGGGGSGLLSQGSGSAPSGLLNSSGGSAANLGPAAPSSGGGSGFATSLNLETLLAAGSNQNINVPDAETVDKVHFVVNNLSTQNMADKAAEVTSRISPEQYGWFAVYLVVKRASIEPNFHALYLGLLDAIGDETMFRLVLDASYSNIKALLSSNKVKTNSGERSLLKNLGSWLGNLTISRNQPVLMRDLDVKALVLESYQTGHMIAVIPFVAKVLEPAKDSVIFKPPNPWTAAVLGLLKEIYSERDLKLNLKFEMERLFKHLEVEIKDQKPSYLLHQVRRDRVNNPDFAADKNAQQGGGLGSMSGSGGSLGSVTGVGTPYEPAAMGSPNPGIGAPSAGGLGASRGDAFAQQGVLSGGALGADDAAAGGLQQHIKIAPAPNLPETTRVALARLLPVALTAAVREIVSPVVERSVTIACMTARELVLKDFAVEPDGARLRKAAHLMVSSLAGSLALVTCREPLKASTATQLRALLQQAGAVPPGDGAAAQALEHAAQTAAADNLELGCSLIEQAATERAVREIDEQLAPAAAARREHREKHGPGGPPFFDPAYLQGRFPGALPESLRPRPGRLAPGPQRIYDDFANVPRAPPPPPGAPPAGAYGQPRAGAAYLQSGPQPPPPPGAYPGQPPPPPGAPGGAPPPPPPGAPGPGPERAGADPTGAGGDPGDRAPDPAGLAFARLDAACASDPAASFALLPETHEARVAVAELVNRRAGDDESLAALAREVFLRAYEGSPGVDGGAGADGAASLTVRRLRRTAHAAALAALCQRSRAVARQVAGWLVYAEDDRALDKAFCESLARAGCLSDPEAARELDAHLASVVGGEDAARAARAAACGAYLAQHCLLVEPCLSAGDLDKTLDALAAYAAGAGAPPGLAALARSARARGGSASDPKEKRETRRAETRDEDPAGMRESVAKHFDEWARVSELPSGDAAVETFLTALAKSKLTREETRDRFARILVELAVTHSLGSVPEGAAGADDDGAEKKSAREGTGAATTGGLSFVAVDAFVRLIAVLCRRAEEPPERRPALLASALAAAARTALRDADERGAAFNPRPYHRIVLGLMVEMSAPDTNLDISHPTVLASFAGALLALQPSRLPGFAYAWLELISHRRFLPRLLEDRERAGWPLLRRLVTAALAFLEPFLRAAALTETVRLLYRGTLRLLLVLLHDFPEFLCDHHLDLCDVIPPNCVQMRNLVLSAFPRAMRLPDPFTPNLKVDLLPEISQSPRVTRGAEDALKARFPALRAELDQFLETRQPAGFPDRLRRALLSSSPAAAVGDARYDAPLVNAVVLRCGVRGVAANAAAARASADGKSNGASSVASRLAHTAPMEVFQRLADDLDAEGRYAFLNAVANQLRFPNAHTHYFSCALLYLFSESASEAVREQITRVLLERLIVNRPHPWGLLVTFIELIKNPRYNFWGHGFTRCAPDIERLFESVARSCIAPAGGPEEEQGVAA